MGFNSGFKGLIVFKIVGKWKRMFGAM